MEKKIISAMRLHSGPWFVLQTKLWILILHIYWSSQRRLVGERWGKGSRVPGKLQCVGMLDVQNGSLQVHSVSVHTQISLCFYQLFFDNIMIASGFVCRSNCWEVGTSPFFLYLDFSHNEICFSCATLHISCELEAIKFDFFKLLLPSPMEIVKEKIL